MMSNADINRMVLTAHLDKNVELIKKIFIDDDTLKVRYIENQMNTSIKSCVVYINGMVDNGLLDKDVIKPFVEYSITSLSKRDLIDIIAKRITLASSAEKTSDFDKITQAIVYGDSVMLVDGCSEALVLNTKGWGTRAIKEPQVEMVLRGPREGFNESIMANLAMLHRKLRTKDLKMKLRSFGARTKTTGCICYLEGVANKGVIAELERRLELFEMDGTLDTNYISEFISDRKYSPFQTIGSSERPDVVAAKLLEGRVALFLDGTPVVLTLPCLMLESFQSNEDYYIGYVFASINRLLRILGFILSTSIPAIYVALTCFHHEMLPTPLIISIALARQNVPLPTVAEAVVMLIMFEILRETGSRIPSSIGQSLSIVGALVIGQAAVDAHLVSSPMIVIVATAGITGLLVPKIKGGVIFIRFILLALSSILGMYGYIFGMIGLFIYLFNVRSFGVPIMTSAFDEGIKDKKDIFIRSPWPLMAKRPRYIAADKFRSKTEGEQE